MKKNLLRCSLMFAVAMLFSVSTFAQHGGAGMGGGRPSGMGPGAAGMPSGGGPGNNGHAGDAVSTGMGHSSMGPHSPTSVLDNGKVDSSLTKALGKSGISVPGGNLKTACSGFKNLGQCIAALHVAKNLNLSFSDLQNKMTGSNSESLGKAIQNLGGPNVNAKSEAKRANKQANKDLSAAKSES